ncbi:glycosyl hydrolase family 61-domain-containing protein [Whalleya microplaca]|nr:glycosyl hydrolase family 61-domain-containing protein [Whalleya microplaca]
MRSVLVAFALATSVRGHATFQQLWVNGKDQQSTCARLPASNSPVIDVESNDIRCNANSAAASSTCPVAAGDTITVEMHQHDSRDCSEQAVGGNHFGPVMVYLSKVSDAAAADGSDSWSKIFESGYDSATKKWGNDILNDNCGKQDVVVPTGIPAGDYLVRAETIALHAAGSEGGAQFYMTCYQISVTGGGAASPAGVSFPGAYSATDPGILINIYNDFGEYQIPGPDVYAAGTSGNTTTNFERTSATSAGTSSAAATAVTTLLPASSATAASEAITSTLVATTSATAITSPTASNSTVADGNSSGISTRETYTLDTFIAWLKQTGSSSSSRRRHARDVSRT